MTNANTTTEDPMNTTTTTVEATDGTRIEITFPTEIPTNDRADYLRGLLDEHLVSGDYGWKGPVHAIVADELADDMAEAMDFIGAHVDKRVKGHPASATLRGRTLLHSRGYWAHGY